MIKSITVKGIHETEDMLRKGSKPTVLISLYDPDSIHDVIMIQNTAIRQGLKTKFSIHAFADVMEDYFGEGPVMTEATFNKMLTEDIPNTPNLVMIENLIKDLKKIVDDEVEHDVLIHCFAGVSRSTAACVILHHLMGKGERECIIETWKIRQVMWPSALILRIADRILGTKFHERILSWKRWETKHPWSTTRNDADW
jgi:predicted protein tyrosine phosphatase